MEDHDIGFNTHPTPHAEAIKDTSIPTNGDNADGDDRENVQPLFDGEDIELILKPFVGMEFDTIKASEEFWKKYGYETGFGGRIQNTNIRKDKIVTSRTYLCSKHGQKFEDKRRINAKPRADMRCNCGVLMRISLKNETGKYYVTKFMENHNHELEGKETVHNLRAHQSISESQAHTIDIATRSGLKPKQTHRHMAIQAGGSENLSFTKKRLNSHLQISRVKDLPLGEATAILDYFQEKSRENPAFFHAYQLDLGGKITNVFWADPSMLVDYEIFGDVVSFDTTFGTNKASRPLGVFSGFNNHRQIVVFGGCLLYDESADSFVWLFKIFLECHRGKLPGIIFTDQDAAMKVALSEVIPMVRHALCTWHIGQNALDNLNRDNAIKGDIHFFMKDFYRCVNDILDADEFVINWREMAGAYGLTENPWLQRVYKLKNQFCIAFMKDIFAAGARTTQMSESLNANLKLDLGSGLTMRSFFNGFDLFLSDVRAKELVSDCYSRQTFPHLINRYSSILKQASTLYTPKIFKLFSEQFELELVVRLDKSEVVDYPHVITATEGDKSYKIDFDPSSMIISCTCCRFEIWGYLCSHILKVFHVCGIDEIPEKYILKRWTRGAKSKHNNVIHRSPGLSNTKKMDILDSEFRRVIHRVIGSSGNENMFEGVRKRIIDIHSFIDECLVPNEKEDETISPTPFVPVNVQNGVIVTGLKRKRKVAPKRNGNRRTVSHTEGKKGAIKLRAMQQKKLKTQSSSQIYATEAAARLGQLMMEELITMHMEHKQFYGSEESDCPQWMKPEELEILPSALKLRILGKDVSDFGGWLNLYSAAEVKDCMQKIQTLKYAQEACYNGVLNLKALSSGLEIGACNWTINSPKGNIACLSSSIFESSHAANFDFKGIRGYDVILYSDFSHDFVEDDDNSNIDSDNGSCSSVISDDLINGLLLNNEESMEEMDQISFITSAALDSVKLGGSVLIPIGRLGIVEQLLESISISLESSNLKVPIYFISSVSAELLAFSNIIPEWLCKERQEKMFSGQSLFAHVELIAEEKLHLFTDVHSQKLLNIWKEPCIVFCSHWSLRLGPVVHLLRRWSGDPHSLLVMESRVDADLALLPFKPIAMKILQCSFLSGMRLQKVQPLLRFLQPKRVLVPENLACHPVFSTINSTQFIPYSENRTINIPNLEHNFSELAIATDLACQHLDWMELKHKKMNISKLKGELVMEDNKHLLLDGNEQQLESAKRRHWSHHWGSINSQSLVETLQKMGMSASLDQGMLDTGSDHATIHILEPNNALIEIKDTSTVISADDEKIASLIFEAICNSLNGL